MISWINAEVNGLNPANESVAVVCQKGLIRENIMTCLQAEGNVIFQGSLSLRPLIRGCSCEWKMVTLGMLINSEAIASNLVEELAPPIWTVFHRFDV